MKTIYLISGLGADKRVFQKLDFQHLNVIHLDWIPYHKNESLESYIFRFSEKIDAKNPHLLCGISFGGVVALELSKITHPEKVILFSSVKYYKHIPWYYHIGKLFVPLIPSLLFEKANFLIKFAFSAQGKNWDLLKKILSEQDGKFVKWSIKALMCWEGDFRNAKNITHIHGTSDRVFPCISPDFKIKNGGHFMILDNDVEVNTILNYIIE